MVTTDLPFWKSTLRSTRVVSQALFAKMLSDILLFPVNIGVKVSAEPETSISKVIHLIDSKAVQLVEGLNEVPLSGKITLTSPLSTIIVSVNKHAEETSLLVKNTAIPPVPDIRLVVVNPASDDPGIPGLPTSDRPTHSLYQINPFYEKLRQRKIEVKGYDKNACPDLQARAFMYCPEDGEPSSNMALSNETGPLMAYFIAKSALMHTSEILVDGGSGSFYLDLDKTFVPRPLRSRRTTSSVCTIFAAVNPFNQCQDSNVCQQHDPDRHNSPYIRTPSISLGQFDSVPDWSNNGNNLNIFFDNGRYHDSRNDLRAMLDVAAEKMTAIHEATRRKKSVKNTSITYQPKILANCRNRMCQKC